MTTPKFGRNYQLVVQTNTGQPIIQIPMLPQASSSPFLNISLPLTIEFDIIRNVLSSANTSTIRVYNLSQAHRNAIRKNVNDWGNVRTVQLYAGYGTSLPLIFSGNISQAWSWRDGVNFITQIEAFDAGWNFINSEVSLSFAAQTPRVNIAQALIALLNGVQLGAIGSAIQGNIPRGNSYSGNAINLLRELSGNGFYIDNQKAYILADNEYLQSAQIAQVSASDGLLNTPVLEQTIMHFDMLFEPKLKIGQLLNLQSQTEPILNGNYKVVSLGHKGTISAAVCGEAVTNVGLLAPYAGTSLQATYESNLTPVAGS